MKVDLSKLQIGMTRQQVIKALGEEPDMYGQGKLDHAEIYVYNGDMELWFHKGCDGTLHTIWQDPQKSPSHRLQGAAWSILGVFEEEPLMAFERIANMLPGGMAQLQTLHETVTLLTRLDLDPEENDLNPEENGNN